MKVSKVMTYQFANFSNYVFTVNVLKVSWQPPYYPAGSEWSAGPTGRYEFVGEDFMDCELWPDQRAVYVRPPESLKTANKPGKSFATLEDKWSRT